MTETAASPQVQAGGEPTLGSLVKQATADMSRLVQCELELAKLEIKHDVKRVAAGAALLAAAAFFGVLILIMLCIALAYGLVALHIWAWAAFLIVAGLLLLIAGIAAAVGLRRMRKLTGLKATRETVQGDIAVLRRGDAPPAVGAS